MEATPPPLSAPTVHPILSNPDSTDVVPSAVVEAGGTADKADATARVPPNTTVPSTRKEGHRRSKMKKATGTAVPSFAEKKLAHLVIDSGAIIKGAGMTLASAAENFWTVPEVISEIRDKKARHHLESLPFELKLREPSSEAMKFAVGFARQTGDLRALSRVDLRVIALTYMLERQETGAAHLRAEPVRKGVKPGSKGKPAVASPASAEQEGAQGASLNPSSDPPQAPAAVDASPSRNRNEDKAAGLAVENEGNVESLCAAVKKAFNDDVVAGEGVGSLASSSRSSRVAGDVSAGRGDGKAVTASSSSTGYVEDGEDEGEEGEEKEEGEGGRGGEELEEQEEQEDDNGGSDGSDDEWEPEYYGEIQESTPPISTKQHDSTGGLTIDRSESAGWGLLPPPPAATAAAGADEEDKEEEEDEEGEGEDKEEEEEEEEGGGEGWKGEGDGEELEGQGEQEDDDEGSDDSDDEWEPDGNIADGENTSPTEAKTHDGGKATFTAADFPTLGGSRSPSPPAATAAATAPAPGSSPTAPASASSWSLMARSNPAPFKIPAKRDPAPLPAAAPPATTALSGDTRPGHFSVGGGGGGGDRPRPDGAKVGTSRILSTAAAFGVSGGGAEEDDGEGWVNPSNFKSQKVAGIGLNGPSQTQRKGGRRGGGGGGAAAGRGTMAGKCRAGCVTTDFAMQNVILQVGLPLLSLDGMAVRKVKQWILRCAACFKTCTDMGKLFCPVCGNASLDRVSCSVNAKTGATYLHLRKNHKVNLRGSKFSIPAPNPTKGRFEGDLLLREDQLLSGIWAQKAKRKEKDVSSMFGEDITGNVGLTVSRSADIIVGYGRKNPNSARGRERRGKKGVKTRP